ncbi:CPBP family intramembrane metalloprotease, partial [Halobacteriales archaeon QH_10_67_13]
PGIAIAAVVFGLVHYPVLTGAGSSGAYVLVVVLAGAVLGIAYEHTHNLLVPIAVHAAWNAVVYLVGYYGAVGVAVPAG